MWTPAHAVAAALLATSPPQAPATQEPMLREPAPAPTDETLAAWREHLLPSPDELRWQQIPWLPTFGEGLLAADAAGKPLLFWGMNGHPLGCT